MDLQRKIRVLIPINEINSKKVSQLSKVSTKKRWKLSPLIELSLLLFFCSKLAPQDYKRILMVNFLLNRWRNIRIKAIEWETALTWKVPNLLRKTRGRLIVTQMLLLVPLKESVANLKKIKGILKSILNSRPSLIKSIEKRRT